MIAVRRAQHTYERVKVIGLADLPVRAAFNNLRWCGLLPGYGRFAGSLQGRTV